VLPTYSHFTFPSLSAASGSGVSFQPSRSSEYRGVSGFRLLWAAGSDLVLQLGGFGQLFPLAFRIGQQKYSRIAINLIDENGYNDIY